MAAGTKIILRFGTSSGEKNFTYNYGNSEALASDVKTAMQTMIANKEIFRYQPMTIISAKVQVTSESEYDLS